MKRSPFLLLLGSLDSSHHSLHSMLSLLDQRSKTNFPKIMEEKQLTSTHNCVLKYTSRHESWVNLENKRDQEKNAKIFISNNPKFVRVMPA